MTKQSRRKFSAEFKAKVALEAIKNEKTMAELGHQFEVNPVTISKWKNECLERMCEFKILQSLPTLQIHNYP